MLQNKFSLIIAATFAAVLAGCGGSGGEPAPKIQFTSQVVFGDSLSDVGSYAVGAVAASKGGLYTVNPAVRNAPINWTELIAADLNLPAPCPAETGLDGNPAFGLNVPHVFHIPGCTSYAQGGSRVTNPFGPGNKNLPAIVGGSADLGQLTVPIVTQIQTHLNAHGGSFSGTEIVFLFAGGNDAIVNTLTYVATVGQALQLGGLPAGQAQAAISGPAAVQAMTTAATELAGYINTMVLGKGAKYVVVLNIPDLSSTPFGVESEKLIPLPGTQAVVKKMVDAFNSQLSASLSASNVVLADLNTASVVQISNPANFGLTNVTDPACKLTVPPAPPNPAVNFLNSSLVCNAATNVIAGDISHYAFADTVHPTPYGYFLIGLFVSQNLGARGWL